MQFPVPQFTDVEDKVIAGLSIKQFGIIFIAGALVFAFYSATKSVAVTIFAGIFVGIPAIALAFVKINGRALYANLFTFAEYFLSPKVLIFRKLGPVHSRIKDTQIEEAPIVQNKKSLVKIKELSYLLQQKASEENELLKYKTESGQ